MTDKEVMINALKQIADTYTFVEDRKRALDKTLIVNWSRSSAEYTYLLGINRNRDIAVAALDKLGLTQKKKKGKYK